MNNARYRAVYATEKVLAMLKEDGHITSTEMRFWGIKRPASVIAKLKKRGYQILSKNINTRHGRKMAVYTLEESETERAEKKTQVESVLEYLEKYGHISSRQAWEKLRVVSLKSVISKLRKRGYLFDTGKAPRGKSEHTTYWLIGMVDPENKICDLPTKKIGQAERAKVKPKRQKKAPEKKVTRKSRAPQILKITRKTGGWWKRR